MRGRSFLEFPFKIWCKTMLIPDYGPRASDVCVNSLICYRAVMRCYSIVSKYAPVWPDPRYLADNNSLEQL